MSVTTSTSCHISPQSFMLVHTSPSPTFLLPKSNLTSTSSTSKSRSGSMSVATTTSSFGPARRVIARSFSVSTPSVSASMASWYPIAPVAVQAHSGGSGSGSGFDVFIDARGNGHDPYFGEMDLATSSRLLRLEYLGNNNNGATDRDNRIAAPTKDYDKKENSNQNGNENVTFNTQSIPLRRIRERARSTRQQDPITPRSIPSEHKIVLEETAEERNQQSRIDDKVEFVGRNPLVLLQPQDHQQSLRPVKMNFWEAEMAAKNELEEDDYSWYYRNPQRHIWRPRNARKRMQRRKRVMCGVATGEEGAPTNRSLFASYLLQHFPSITVVPPLGVDTERSSRGFVGGKPPTPTGTRSRSVNRNTSLVVDELSPRSMDEDCQEDLFSLAEHDALCSRRSKSDCRSSLYSEHSHHSDSSVDSSQRTTHEDTFCHGCLTQYRARILPHSRAAINVE